MTYGSESESATHYTTAPHKQMVSMQVYSIPEIFKNFFTFNVDIHSYNTRFTNNLHLFKINTAYGRRSIKFKCPVLWNNLTQSIRNLYIKQFKSKLTEFLWRYELLTWETWIGLLQFMKVDTWIVYFLFLLICMINSTNMWSFLLSTNYWILNEW